jgi:Spy/CpxP family protein refolding chaperone
MTRRATFLLAAALGLSGSPLAAQTTPAPEPTPLEEVLFPPELIMQHRRAIDLTDEQRDAISGMIRDLQGRIVGLQWDLLDEMQALTEILERPRVELDRALDAMEAVLDIEKQVKQAHLELLVRIKNLLTPEQQATLTRLRAGGG